MKAALAAALLLACSGPARKGAERPGDPPPGVGAYLMDAGSFEGGGTIRTAGGELPWSIHIERSCEGTTCQTRFTREMGSQTSSYVSHTEVRPTGEYEVYYKDDSVERREASLRIPSPDRLPHEWSKPSFRDQNSDCRATSDETFCPGGMRLHCETASGDGAVVVDVRVMCPDRGETLRRHVGTYTRLCEQLMDVSYDRWRGAPASDSAALATPPDGCERASPLGWTRQTPNRSWSVALPARGRMVNGPDKWTVNLHESDMSYIAYEGTGPNASVKRDADIPGMAQMYGETVAPLIGAEVGEPKKRESAHPVDWLIPLTRDGKFAGAVRLIARDNVMYSLSATGADEEKATSFLESFLLHEAGFGEAAAREFDDYIEAGTAYKDKICACDTLACARAVPELVSPTRGFPSPAQEARLGELVTAINDCASKLAAKEQP